MIILALDLGSKTGWARFRDGFIISGTQRFSPNRHESQGMVWLRWETWLEGHMKEDTIVYYEAVVRHVGTHAAHLYGGFLSILHKVCDKNGIPYEGIPVGTIKKFITGKGNASKDLVSVSIMNVGYSSSTSDEADALAILFYALEQLGIDRHVWDKSYRAD